MRFGKGFSFIIAILQQIPYLLAGVKGEDHVLLRLPSSLQAGLVTVCNELSLMAAAGRQNVIIYLCLKGGTLLTVLFMTGTMLALFIRQSIFWETLCWHCL